MIFNPTYALGELLGFVLSRELLNPLQSLLAVSPTERTWK